MARRTYRTLAPELEEYADLMADDLEVHGYEVNVEKQDPGFPYVPTLVAKRGHTTLIVDVSNSIDPSRLDSWVVYGKSCGHDLQVIACVPDSAQVAAKEQQSVRDRSCGLAIVSKSHISRVVSPKDLGLNISLPPRASLSPRLRSLLGAAYDRFDEGDWRDGFEEACRVLETQARSYLKHWIKTRRIHLVTSSGPKKLGLRKIEKLTMGQLAITFSEIVAKTHADSQIEKALDLINKERVPLAHHRHKPAMEKRLRANVDRDMLTIIETLKLLA